MNRFSTKIQSFFKKAFLKSEWTRQLAQILKENKIWAILFFTAFTIGLIFFSFWFFKISPKNLLERILPVSFEEIKNEEIKTKQSESPAPEIYRRKIDGMIVDSKEKINPPLFAVQVENMVDARPLSGISKANLVYEAIAEAGITRLLALYTSDNVVPEIGPVRSARPYYIDWASEYGALYAHSGGSPEALRIIPSYDVLDLNEFSNGKYFWRSKSRYAPHNLYTSTELLGKAFDEKNSQNPSTSLGADFEPWQFKDEVEFDGRPSEERRIKIYFSTSSYEVGWQYNRETNDYLRYQAGLIQRDRDGSEVRAKNIVVQFVKMITLDSEGRKRVETIGSGEAIIFQDGLKIEGEWRKEKKGERTKFYDSVGAEIKFNPGVTWVEVVPIGTEVKF